MGFTCMTESRCDLAAIAHRVRQHILAMGASREGAHIGGSLSAADVLTVLYFDVLRVCADEPRWPERDYFILSKGHAAAALYACLAEAGFFPIDELRSYVADGSRLAAHPLRCVPGVELPTGSLGHGLSLAVGLALAAKRDARPNRAYVLLGDGELQEGSVWEGAMAAAHYQLDNLVAVVDRNGLQINGPTEAAMRVEPLADRWRSFGWRVASVDGHDRGALRTAFAEAARVAGQPFVIIASTVKGRGVAFLEGRHRSHHVVLTAELYARARRALATAASRS
jgi:transketolase